MKVNLSMATEMQTLSLDEVRIDGGTQPRLSIDEQVVAEYADLYRNGINLPPVTVFFDGVAYWLADGFHRYWAHRRIDCDCIFANVSQGTQRDAILYSVGANADHGLRRSNADKRKAVLTMLEDEEWSRWSDSDIARQCGVTHTTVQRHRVSLAQCASELPPAKPSQRTYRTKHGTVATMKTANIGHPRPRGVNSPNPVRQPRPALAQTNINLPHDPTYGARAIVSAMGPDYAKNLIGSLTTYFQQQKEGEV